MKNTLLRYAVCIFSLFFLLSCNGKIHDKRVLKLAHGLPKTHSVHQGMLFMKERLNTLSGGKMDMEIYDSGQLGGENQTLELLQIGSLDMAKVSSGALEGFVDEFKVFGLPYLFVSKEHYFEVLDGPVGKAFLETTVPYWIKGLGYYDSGARSFYTVNRAIRTPEDLKGLKIRVMRSPIAVEMMRTFDGSATPVDFGELYTALQSGVVDGAENNTPSVTTAFHHEICKYYSVNEHTMLPDLVVISLHTWDKLSGQERKWLTQAMDESVVYQRKLWEEQEKNSMAEMQEKGMEIFYPEKQPFILAARPLLDKYRENEKYRPWIDAVLAVGDSLTINSEKK
ncbi:MAG: TRAP transporter substrate-binding protein [Bacteroidales bacterium]|nr:TRAP transporter substrate-binding protein [Bacteroidales bacterium]